MDKPTTAIVQTDMEGNLALTAHTPLEMGQCQQALVAWFARKIELVKREALELTEAFEVAARNKWASTTLKRHADLARKRITYYEKIKMALEAGYCIVPHFPISLFAIRTDAKKPKKYGSFHKWENRTQGGKALPPSEGKHVSPNPTEYEKSVTVIESGKEIAKTQHWAEDFAEVQFPANMAKPQIMEATERAMALKIFDEFGVLPDPNPRKDPVIIGKIIDPNITSSHGGRRAGVQFIIAWHLNTADL